MGITLQDVVQNLSLLDPIVNCKGKKEKNCKKYSHKILQIISCLETIVDGVCVVDDLFDLKLHLV